MWVDGFLDVIIPVEELLEEFINPPKWVEKSLRNQLKKLYGSDFKNLGR